MRRSSEFSAAVKYGRRAVAADIVVHARQVTEGQVSAGGRSQGPRIGLIVAKSVGSSVDRHRVARRLRHICRGVVADLERSEHVVIRARPSSSDAPSARLDQQLRASLRRIHKVKGPDG